jgi:formylglycine-generating enzyme required for sulfatase activity
MGSKPPDAFLSYTRFDDRQGKISQFRQELEDEVRAVTGVAFAIFQDVDDIDVGERWSDKLDQMLDVARFFIPILTPSYFNSAACRDELKKFLKAEERAGRDDLILPIYWITCPVLENKELRQRDDLAIAIDQRHRWDWRDLREHTFRNRKVRLKLHELAEAIATARQTRVPRRARRRVIPEAPARRLREEARISAVRPRPEPRVVVPSPQAAAKNDEKEFEVVLVDAGRRKLHVETVVKMVNTRLDSKEARRLVVSAPQAIKRRVSKADAEKIKDRLEGYGATVWVRPTGSTAPKPGIVFCDIDAPWCPQLVVVPPGGFMMGSPEDEAARTDAEGPQHPVTFASPFALGKYPVTFEEYDHFCAESGRAKAGDQGWGRGRRPVINVSWEDAQAYCAWLSEQAGEPYRLPSAAEWEYGCRAGTPTPFWTGATISTDQANYDGNHTYQSGGNGVYREQTTRVDTFEANPWHLRDMHGNVWEWCQDCWNARTYTGAPNDGSACTSGDCARKVIRGGSWNNRPEFLRSASRGAKPIDNRNDMVGFRVARAQQ